MKHFLLLITTCSVTGLLKASHPHEASVIPFLLYGNSIVVKAIVNGTEGNFLLDTGSPSLLLNDAYFEGITLRGTELNLLDIHGQAEELSHFSVRSLRIGNLQLPDKQAFVVNLGELETSKGIPLTGILGYSSLRNLEIVFDFDNLLLWLLPLDKKGRKQVDLPGFRSVDSFSLRMSGHIPYITVSVENKKVRLGIDTGSEINMIQKKFIQKRPRCFQVIGNFIVKGLSKKHRPCGRGILKGIQFRVGKTCQMEFAIADMEHLNNQLQVNLHGLLGAPFLMQGKVALNLRQRKLYLGQSLEDGLAWQAAFAGERSLVSQGK